MAMKEMLISVIVPTRNSAQTIGLCLASVKNQTYKNIEMIVVDNNSTDGTKEIARKYTEKVFNKGPERTSQRNFGIKVAKGDFILSLDSDQELPGNMIGELAKLGRDYDAVLIEDYGIGTTFWSKAHAFEKAIHFNDREVTAPRFINRKKLIEIGCFDENLVLNEDLDLHIRMKQQGFRVGHVPLLINHYEGGSLLEHYRKSFYYGTTAEAFFKKNPKRGMKIYILYHPLVYLKNWKYFLKHPIYGSASIVRKIATYIAAAHGIAYNRMQKNLKLQIMRSIANSDVSYMILYVTSKCNSKCLHCFYWRELNKKKNELTLDEIEKLSKGFKNLLYLNLTGGEPFLREDIDKIVYYFYRNSKSKFVNISTNGILSDVIREKVKEILNSCKDIHLNISVSLDAVGEKHDKIRGVKGNFEKSIKTIKYLNELKNENKNLRIIANTVFSKYNKDEVMKLHEHLLGLNVDQHRVGIVRKGGKVEEIADVSLDEFDAVVKKIDEKKIYGKDIYSRLFHVINEINREINVRTLREKRMIIPCVAGEKMIVINEEGNVYPCEILNKAFGNIRDYNYDVMKMLRSDAGKSLRSYIKKSKCYCSWGCATQNNIIFNYRNYPRIIMDFLRTK